MKKGQTVIIHLLKLMLILCLFGLICLCLYDNYHRTHLPSLKDYVDVENITKVILLDGGKSDNGYTKAYIIESAEDVNVMKDIFSKSTIVDQLGKRDVERKNYNGKYVLVYYKDGTCTKLKFLGPTSHIFNPEGRKYYHVKYKSHYSLSSYCRRYREKQVYVDEDLNYVSDVYPKKQIFENVDSLWWEDNNYVTH